MNVVKVGDRIKLNKVESFELPLVVEVRNGNEVVLQRRKKRGRLSIPMNRLVKMPNSYRGAVYSFTTKSKI